jgi:hypothetical protein
MNGHLEGANTMGARKSVELDRVGELLLLAQREREVNRSLVAFAHLLDALDAPLWPRTTDDMFSEPGVR